jgi:hypothetical protein
MKVDCSKNDEGTGTTANREQDQSGGMNKAGNGKRSGGGLEGNTSQAREYVFSFFSA